MNNYSAAASELQAAVAAVNESAGSFATNVPDVLATVDMMQRQINELVAGSTAVSKQVGHATRELRNQRDRQVPDRLTDEDDMASVLAAGQEVARQAMSWLRSRRKAGIHAFDAAISRARLKQRQGP